MSKPAKPPTLASQKKVTPENLARLGADRLAGILFSIAQSRPELKRRLRMELAAEQGAEHLALEIDKRLASLETSRSRVTWRQRATFIRDIEALRHLIADRLAALDGPAAVERLWRLMNTAPEVRRRVRDRDGALAALYQRAATDIGGLVEGGNVDAIADGLAAAIVRDPADWSEWISALLEPVRAPLAQRTLDLLSKFPDPMRAWVPVVRHLAAAAGAVDAYIATFSEASRRTPQTASDIAGRLLAAGRIAEAGEALDAAFPLDEARRPNAVLDYDWETVWIDYLERAGEPTRAQDARWAAFERTLSTDRLRSFVARLSDFDDVEAEMRGFEFAVSHVDFPRALRFLMEWPALPEAARLIETRKDEIDATPEDAELWASKLRARQPAAAELLLRKVAARAFRRRDYATCDRLTQEADALSG